MSDDSAIAGRLFPSAAAEAQQLKPAASGDDAAPRLFPKAEAQAQQKAAAEAADQPKGAQQAQAKPKGADQPTATEQAQAAPQAVAAIASALAGQAELGLAADHPDTVSFSKVAAEAGISPENAAKLAAWDASRTEAAWDAQFQTWDKATHSEFLHSDLEAARNLVVAHGDQELDELLTGWGLGSHPALVRLLVNISQRKRVR